MGEVTPQLRKIGASNTPMLYAPGHMAYNTAKSEFGVPICSLNVFIERADVFIGRFHLSVVVHVEQFASAFVYMIIDIVAMRPTLKLLRFCNVRKKRLDRNVWIV